MGFENQLKTVLLLGLLTGILLAIGALIGGRSGLTIALIIALVMNFLTYWFSDKIVLFMYGAKEASKTKYHKLYELVKEVSRKASLPMPKVYIINDKSPNAFATGRNPSHSVVAFTQGILELLDEHELKGVIAHEMAHIKNRDMLISTMAAVIAGAISYIAFMARFAAIFGGSRDNGRGMNIIELLVLVILAPLIALIIRLAISRSREFLADETGAKTIKDPISLANALTKLNSGAKAIPMRHGNEATSHIFIVYPFSGHGLFKLFSTHPSLQERVGKLRSMAARM